MRISLATPMQEISALSAALAQYPLLWAHHP